jgi:Domain of unknown function DUF29
MATALLRPSFYEEDYLAWTEQQVALLRAGRADEVDLGNLIDELEDMGRAEWRDLENRLESLLAHMLKRDYQPEKRSRSWGQHHRRPTPSAGALVQAEPQPEAESRGHSGRDVPLRRPQSGARDQDERRGVSGSAALLGRPGAARGAARAWVSTHVTRTR